MTTKISARVLCDSCTPWGKRIITFFIVFPRIILSELNTHRMLSKNSASSRAIPVEAMIQSVLENPFIPVVWTKNHTGMQGTEYITDETEVQRLTQLWLEARDKAVVSARELHKCDLSKQIINRLLEPFMWHSVILTATELDNFFKLRDEPSAEMHIQILAREMKRAMQESEPKLLQPGQMHIPFGDKFDEDRIAALAEEQHLCKEDIKARIAVARCARISYSNFEGKDDYNVDLALFKRLLLSEPLHASPAEHIAVCAQDATQGVAMQNETHKYHSNLKGGWIQLRKIIENNELHTLSQHQ